MEKLTEIIKGFYGAIAKDPERTLLYMAAAFVAIVIIILVSNFFGMILEFFKNRRIEKNGVLLEILVKETTTAKITEALIRNIHSTLLNTKFRELVNGRPYMSFEIAAEQGKITFYVWVPKDYKNVIMERIYATYPECAIRQVPDYLPKRVWTVPKDYINYFKDLRKGEKTKFPRNYQSIFGTEMELAYHHVLSLNKVLDGEDILGSLISSMKNLEFHEKAVVQILTRPVSGKWQVAGRKVLQKYELEGIRPNKKGSFGMNFSKLAEELDETISGELSELTGGAVKPKTKRKTRPEGKEIRGAAEKIFDAGFETTIRLATVGNFEVASRSRLKMLGASFNELDKENKLTRKMIYAKRRFYKRLRSRRVYLFDRKNILTPAELSKFFMRLPGTKLINEHNEIQALVVKEFAPPKNVENETLLIGVNNYRGKETKIGIKFDDLKRHIIVQGKTGTGKSEWAKELMYQLMEMGLGYALFEPHGKLALETMQLVPESRRKDVIVVDLFDDYPTPFNFCKVRQIPGRRIEDTIEKTAKELIDINKRLFSEAWSGKNAYYIENGIKTVIELKGGNYVDIRRLLSDAEFREYAAENIRDPQLKHFWREEFKTNAKGELLPGTQATVNSVDYKLGSFLNSKSLLRAVGQDDCIDFKDIMDNNKILIFRFDKERMSEDQLAFIGGIAIKMLIVEAFRRDKNQWGNPFPIIIDEAQNFVNPSIETILDELRKYGVPLVMMHQRLAQLDKVPGLRDAIYGNVGSRLSFAAGEPDAPYFEKVFSPRIDQRDITRLPSRYGYCQLMVDGHTSETFNIYTLDTHRVSEKEAAKSVKEIMENNRKDKLHYKEIDKLIANRLVGSLKEASEDHFEEIESNAAKAWTQAEEEAAATSAAKRPAPQIRDMMKPKSVTAVKEQEYGNLYETEEYLAEMDGLEELLEQLPDPDLEDEFEEFEDVEDDKVYEETKSEEDEDLWSSWGDK